MLITKVIFPVNRHRLQRHIELCDSLRAYSSLTGRYHWKLSAIHSLDAAYEEVHPSCLLEAATTTIKKHGCLVYPAQLVHIDRNDKVIYFPAGCGPPLVLQHRAVKLPPEFDQAIVTMSTIAFIKYDWEEPIMADTSICWDCKRANALECFNTAQPNRYWIKAYKKKEIHGSDGIKTVWVVTECEHFLRDEEVPEENEDSDFWDARSREDNTGKTNKRNDKPAARKRGRPHSSKEHQNP